MGKYDHLKILKKTKARTHHICQKCGKEILPKENYYKEYIKDKFLHSLHPKKYCSSCYEENGNDLLSLS
jgi:ribosomal protein L37E